MAPLSSHGNRHTVPPQGSAVVSGSLQIHDHSSALYELMQMNSNWLRLVTASNSGLLSPVVAEEPDSATVTLLANNTSRDCEHSLGAIQNASAESNIQRPSRHPQVPMISTAAATDDATNKIKLKPTPEISPTALTTPQSEISTTAAGCLLAAGACGDGSSATTDVLLLLLLHPAKPLLLQTAKNSLNSPTTHIKRGPPASAQTVSRLSLTSQGANTRFAMSQAQKALEDAGLSSVHPLMKQGSFVAKQQPSRERAG
ncbi:hypothetical protein CEUSTIGMA_g10709.t1 [Chlamydomonas eustigma]|uniref:Uncharacterized protein n=1 Tax=Chlamydomonas eustigma TaxID=1157962 RepID=A0A250XJS3_9CHLO|nr:hypothetical protein CEUSTIGMA_g10709.t1 [Chlamydomonas eustigma]|eukprot:GAX83283.1 hypothetical protein CEUSTIGMA_g10709.t1 [Chlamydomonas eustigma]